MAYYDYDDDDIEEKAEELEDAKKITEEACIAYLRGDHDEYWEEMKRAAEDVLMGYPPHFLSRREIKQLMDIYGEPLEEEEDYTPPPPPKKVDLSKKSDPPVPPVEDQQSDKEFEKQVEALAVKLDAEGKITKDAWDFFLMGLHKLYWGEMKFAALKILSNEPVTFLTPEEIQKMRDDYHAREQLPAPQPTPQYNYAPQSDYTTAPEQVGCFEGCLKCFLGILGLMFIGILFVSSFGIVMSLLSSGSGIIVLIVLYKLFRYLSKK